MIKERSYGIWQIDTSDVDHVQVMERYVSELTRQHSDYHGGTYKRACHLKNGCAGLGDDRLQLYPCRPAYDSSLSEEDNKALDAGPCYWCSQCHRSGNILQFIADSEGLDWDNPKGQASILQIAGITNPKKWNGGTYKHRSMPAREKSRVTPPSEQWSKAARDFCISRRNWLWSDEPKALEVRQWLTSERGLTEKSISRAGLGYNPDYVKLNPEEWGLEKAEKDYWVPDGLVIPWLMDQAVWYVQIRVSNQTLEKHRQRWAKRGKEGSEPARYLPIKGGQIGLYNANKIQPGTPLILVESVLDALVGQQETGSDAVWCASGTTGGAHDMLWQSLIRQTSPVILGYDFDGNRAGDNAFFKFWQKQGNITRWQPWNHDISDMKKAGLDVALWASIGINLARSQQTPTAQESVPANPDENRSAPLVEPMGTVCTVPAIGNTISEVVTSEHPRVSSPDEPKAAPGSESAEPYIPVCWSCGSAIDERRPQPTDGQEQDEQWRSTPTGTLFCMACWKSKRLDLLPDQLDIEVLVESFLARPCASCGGHDWQLDPEIASDAVARSSGYLICPCLLAKRELAARPRPAAAQPTDERIRCSHCEQAGRLAYGVANYRKTPGKAFYYVRVSNGTLICPGCLDVIEDPREQTIADEDLLTANNNPEFASAYRYIEEYNRKQQTSQAVKALLR